jgi:transposase InsO family protein
MALDLYDRKVIGWAFSTDMETVHTAIPALRMAFTNRATQNSLLFHSGRGVQYCAKSFRDCLEELHPSVRQSISRKGKCRDNAYAESFFKTLKRGKHSAAEVRQAVFRYVETYYNRVYFHSALDYAAPNVFNSVQPA